MMKQQNDSFFCGYNEQTESAAVQAVVIKKHRPEKNNRLHRLNKIRDFLNPSLKNMTAVKERIWGSG